MSSKLCSVAPHSPTSVLSYCIQVAYASKEYSHPVPLLRACLQINTLKKQTLDLCRVALHPEEPREHSRATVPKRDPCPGCPCSPADTAQGSEQRGSQPDPPTTQHWRRFHPKGLFWFSSSCDSNKLITDDMRLNYNWTADKIVQALWGGGVVVTLNCGMGHCSEDAWV